jgi:hypothetical protein
MGQLSARCRVQKLFFNGRMNRQLADDVVHHLAFGAICGISGLLERLEQLLDCPMIGLEESDRIRPRSPVVACRGSNPASGRTTTTDG